MKILLNELTKITLNEVLENENVKEGKFEEKLKSLKDLELDLSNREISRLIEKIMKFISKRRYVLPIMISWPRLPTISETDDKITVKGSQLETFFKILYFWPIQDIMRDIGSYNYSDDDIDSGKVTAIDIFASLQIGVDKDRRKIILKEDSVGLSNMINEMLCIAHQCIWYI